MTIAKYFVAEAGEDDGELGAFYAQVVGAFEEVALMATSGSVPLNDVLRLVGRRLCELLGVTRCSVYLRRDDGRFQGQVGYCVGRSIDAGVARLVSGVEADRFTAEIVATSSPVVVHDATHDPRTIQRTMRQWGVRDILGVPLVVEADVIGIIYVDNQAVPHDFTDRDLKLAQAFAGLSAIAVRQSWLYTQLGERAKIIDHQRRVLGDSTVVHNRVTRAVLDGATTEAILRLIVDLLGKPAVLYSSRLEIVSWAAPEGTGDLTRDPGLTAEHLALPWVQRAIASLHNGSSSVMLRATPETRCRRLMVRMVVDQQCVGYLELCELGRTFSAVDAKALEQASMAVALKLLTDQRNVELCQQEREEYFADIVYGRRDIEALTSRAERFGIDLEARHGVLRLQYAEVADIDAAIGHKRRQAIVTEVNKQLGAAGRAVAGTSVPGADLLLIEVPPGEMGTVDGAMYQALKGMLDQLIETYGVRFAVVSNTCTSLSDLPTVAEDVRDTVELLRETGAAPRMTSTRELELLRLVGRRDGLHGARQHADDLLRPLAEHDAVNGGALLPTIIAFVRCHGQIRSTAAALSVHENTVRYRLNRIRDVSSIEPGCLESLLGVALALQVRDLPGPAVEFTVKSPHAPCR